MAEKKEIKKTEKASAEKSKPTVEQLLSQLKQVKAQGDKEGARLLRRKLRVMGHKGGLGDKVGRPAAKTVAKPAAKPAAKTVAKPAAKK